MPKFSQAAWRAQAHSNDFQHGPKNKESQGSLETLHFACLICNMSDKHTLRTTTKENLAAQHRPAGTLYRAQSPAPAEPMDGATWA